MKSLDQIDKTLNHLFRQESGKMVAVLVKIFGVENIELVEDVVQDALVRALETWKYNGMPQNPKAWLYRTAKNKAIDVIRRNKYSQLIDFSSPKKQLLISEYTLVSTIDEYWKEDHIKDDFLGMMYACCDPNISQENQITFILKTLCGFSTKEIAKSFLCSEDTISKRLYRTKGFYRKHKILPEIPTVTEILPRTKTVLSAIYLIFNEGYCSTHTDQLIRRDLISQAMILCKTLLSEERTRLPEVFALMALMCFHTARIDSRVSVEGGFILLADQDRSKWDADMIQSGAEYLNKAAFGKSITTYHIEAAIAYQHCCAKQYSDTNWEEILRYYDMLLEISFDPIVFLNRCLVVLNLNGPKKALAVLDQMKDNLILQKYYLYHGALGEINKQMNNNSKAVSCFQNAIRLTQSEQEKIFFKHKIDLIVDTAKNDLQ